MTKLLALFGNLKPRYQEFVLNQVDQFLKMQDEGDDSHPLQKVLRGHHRIV
ncbi:hypothetical protein FACS1894142_8770 [Spirochaetia bacterium]|nr:hypothetical protein FACS1894142_8770 [Spirochaetia bacterium]